MALNIADLPVVATELGAMRIRAVKIIEWPIVLELLRRAGHHRGGVVVTKYLDDAFPVSVVTIAIETDPRMTTIKNPLPASLTVPAGGDIAGYAPDFWSDYGQFNPPLVHSWQAVIASWVERIVDLI